MTNYSKQREEIIETIKVLDNHPTAEEIYFLIKQKDPAVSRSTVYRNLNRLVQNNIITQIAISNGPNRYEYTENIENHGYAVCMKCGKIYNFSYDFDKLNNSIIGQTGIEILKNGIVVKGVCIECKKASNYI